MLTVCFGKDTGPRKDLLIDSEDYYDDSNKTLKKATKKTTKKVAKKKKITKKTKKKK